MFTGFAASFKLTWFSILLSVFGTDAVLSARDSGLAEDGAGAEDTAWLELCSG